MNEKLKQYDVHIQAVDWLAQRDMPVSITLAEILEVVWRCERDNLPTHLRPQRRGTSVCSRCPPQRPVSRGGSR